MRLPDFIQIPGILFTDDDIKGLDQKVYGIIYWYSKLKLKRCILSNKQIANLVRAKPGSVANSISRLAKKKYVKVVLDEEVRQRLELIPLITFNRKPTRPHSFANDTPSSANDTPPSLENEHNNIDNTNNIKNKQKGKNIPLDLYKYYVKRFNKNPKRYRPLPERMNKIKIRLRSWTPKEIATAIRNASLDDFYSGKNERGWTADISYICRNDDILERLLNLKPRRTRTAEEEFVDITHE